MSSFKMPFLAHGCGNKTKIFLRTLIKDKVRNKTIYMDDQSIPLTYSLSTIYIVEEADDGEL